MSSAGWFGCIRIPRTPGWPIVFRHCVTTRILLAAITRSLLLISFVTAATTSGVSAKAASSSMPIGRPVVENPLAKLADREAAEWLERGSIDRVQNQTADFIGLGIDQRMVDDFFERQVSKNILRGHALALGPGSDHRELVAGFLFVGLGKDLAQIGEPEAFAIDHARKIQGFVSDAVRSPATDPGAVSSLSCRFRLATSALASASAASNRLISVTSQKIP